MKGLLFILVFAAASSTASAQAVTVKLSEWKIELSRDTVQAGPVTFRVSNGGSMNHAFYVRGPGMAKGMREVAKDESSSLTLTLAPGTYEVYCPLADGSHKMAGMTKQLVVVAAKKPADN